MQLIESGSFVIMDILVEFEDGSIFNLEIQKIGYLFPGQRSSCYVSDLIMRQYNRLRSAADKEHPFNYRNMKPVQLLVLMQDSPAEFKAVAPHYVHTRKTSYSSGAQVEELENITYLSLDTFRKVVQNNVDNELHAWLTFLCNDEPEAICNLITAYPSFITLYQEIAAFRTRPEEVTHMFSEALLEMDRNLERFMIEEARKEVAALKEESVALKRECDIAAQERDAAAQERDSIVKERDSVVKERDSVVKERDAEHERVLQLEALLTQHNIPFERK